MRLGREEMEHNRHQRHQVEDGADYPHQRAGRYLVGQSGNAEDSRSGRIAGVNHPAGKGQERGQGGIDQVRANEIGQHAPAGSAAQAGPRLDHGKPEEQGRNEKAGVLHLVPARRPQCQFIGLRDVPGEVGDIHGQPGEYGMSQRTEQPVQHRGTEERTQTIAKHRVRQGP